MLWIVTIVLGLTILASLCLGDTAPEGGAAPESFAEANKALGNALAGGDDPPAEEEEGDTDAGSGSGDGADRTKKWSDDMSAFEEFIPEDRKHTFRNKVEQAQRWGKGVPETPKDYEELKAGFTSTSEFAEVAAGWFEDGPERLKELGPTKFLQELKGMDWAAVSAFYVGEAKPPEGKKDEAPAADDRVSKLEAKLAKMEKAEQDRAKQSQQEKMVREFYESFTPAVDAAAKEMGFEDEQKTNFAEVAKQLFIADANAGKQTTPAEAVERAKTMFGAPKRKKGSSKPPEGEVIEDPNATGEAPAGGPQSYKEAFTAMSDTMAKSFNRKQQG